jgi:outer membrane protein assembly factor BamD (BamD/ComL family)
MAGLIAERGVATFQTDKKSGKVTYHDQKKAIEIYKEKLIARFPETPWAEKAKKRLQDLGAR